jgi:hypothetical protein
MQVCASGMKSQTVGDEQLQSEAGIHSFQYRVVSELMGDGAGTVTSPGHAQTVAAIVGV